MKRNYMKTLIVAAGLLVGSMSAWAYTPALSQDYTINGYKLKAFYNIANENIDGMCPVYAVNQFTYRGGGFGWYNYGSGNRGNDVTLSVSEGDLLIAEFKDTQSRSVTINSITNCTKNDTYSSGDFLAYDVKADATTLTINVGRAGCIIAFLVMEKDASATTYDYTINYRAGDTTIKTTSGNVAEGTEITADNTIYVDEVKYNANAGQTMTLTVGDNSTELIVEVTEVAKFNYTISQKLGTNDATELASGSRWADEPFTYYYPKYVTDGINYYVIESNTSEPSYGIEVSSSNTTPILNYTLDEDVVYYAEYEDILTNKNTYEYFPGPSSKGTSRAITKSGVMKTAMGLAEDGIFDITIVGGNRDTGHTTTMEMKLIDSNQTVSEDNVISQYISGGAWMGEMTAKGVTIPAGSELYIANDNGDGNAKFAGDYIVVKKSPATVSAVIVADYGTFSSPYALDLSSVTAYIVSAVNGTTLELTQVTSAPAKTGLLIEGAGSYDIPVIANSSEDVSANLLKGVNTDTEITSGYVLQNQTEKGLGFYLVDGTKTVPAGKAYLNYSVPEEEAEEAKALYFDNNATAIEAISALTSDDVEGIYTVGGAKLNSLQKGINIVKMQNGTTQKVLVK